MFTKKTKTSTRQTEERKNKQRSENKQNENITERKWKQEIKEGTRRKRRKILEKNAEHALTSA